MANRTQNKPQTKPNQKTKTNQRINKTSQPKSNTITRSDSQENNKISPLETAAQMLADRLRNSDDTLEHRELISITNALRQMSKDQIGLADQPSTMSTAQLHRELERTRQRITDLERA